MADTIIFWPYEDIIKEAGYAKGPEGSKRPGATEVPDGSEQLDQMST